MSDDKKQEEEEEPESATTAGAPWIPHSSAQPAEGDPDAGTESGISAEAPAEG